MRIRFGVARLDKAFSFQIWVMRGLVEFFILHTYGKICKFILPYSVI